MFLPLGLYLFLFLIGVLVTLAMLGLGELQCTVHISVYPSL